MGIFDLFRKKESPDVAFWSWFATNEDRLFYFEKDQEKIFDELNGKLRAIHPSVTFEFGPVKQGKREFVISADGIREAFPFVERTFEYSPELDRWIFIKFRPRRGTFEVKMNGRELSAEYIAFRLEKDGIKIGIELYVRGYDPSERDQYIGLVFILLDSAIGEFDMETKVGFIELFEWEKMPAEAKNFSELPETFDQMWAASLN